MNLGKTERHDRIYVITTLAVTMLRLPFSLMTKTLKTLFAPSHRAIIFRKLQFRDGLIYSRFYGNLTESFSLFL